MSTAPSPIPLESPALSSSDFPALSAAAEQSPATDVPQDTEPPAVETEVLDTAAQEKAARKAAKKAAAAERAAERARLAQEKAAARAAEKERLAKEKAAEKERLAVLKAEKEKAAKEKAEKEKAEREKAAKEREQAAKERAEKEAAEKAERERVAEAQRAAAAVAKANKHAAAAKGGKSSPAAPVTVAAASADKSARKAQASKQSAPTNPSSPEPVIQAPILAKMPKKNKPVTKPIKIPKEDHAADPASTLPSAATSDAPQLPDGRDSSSNNSRAHSVDRAPAIQPLSIKDMLAELHVQFPWLDLPRHPFFDMSKINPASKVPLEYGPLVHALSALSVGGGSFANNMPTGSIDNAVSSFQQLLETLTQTISDLLRLLPRTTWDDSSSFDGVLRDMLKGDDFLEDGGDDQNSQGKEDEVAALTLALERRARWMEVQLSKLEELHRDINTAAVRAVLSFNDNGWDPNGSLPRLGNTLPRFDNIGLVKQDGEYRAMSADELEKKLVVAKEAAHFVEAELREVMQNLQGLKPADEHEDY